MTDLTLRFPNRAAWQAMAIVPGPTMAIDEIGTYSKETTPAVISVAGVVITAAIVTPVAGYHVNLRVLDGRSLTALQPYVVTPSTPMRRWA